LNGVDSGGTITTVSRHNLRTSTGAGRRATGTRHSALLLLTIGALLFVGMQSRVAQSIPSRSPEQLLTSLADPVKFPPPEERGIDAGWILNVASADAVVEPAAQPMRDTLAPVPYLGERHASANLLRAPPASL